MKKKPLLLLPNFGTGISSSTGGGGASSHCMADEIRPSPILSILSGLERPFHLWKNRTWHHFSTPSFWKLSLFSFPFLCHLLWSRLGKCGIVGHSGCSASLDTLGRLVWWRILGSMITFGLPGPHRYVCNLGTI